MFKNNITKILISIFLLIGFSLFTSTVNAEATTALSQDANNLTHAYDGNDITSANILSDTGYITYNLTDLGLTCGTRSKYIIGTSDGDSHSITVDYVYADLTLHSSVTLAVYGFKDDYTTEAIPAGVTYVRINGITGALVYIYEITAYTPTSTAAALSRGANNLTHAYDRNHSTSANILTSTGWIIYNLADIGLTGSTGGKYIIGTSDGGSHNITLDYLDANLDSISDSSVTLKVYGSKDDYIVEAIPEGAAFVKINGTSEALVYIYEIMPYSPAYTAEALSRGASNLTHGYDGNDITSANILSGAGYIIYNLADIGLTGSTGGKYIIGTSNGGSHSIILEYKNANLGSISSITLAVYGSKDDYITEAIPDGAAYVKIHGTPGALVYIYEIMQYSPAYTAEALSRGAGNLTHGYDGNDITSANILSSTGYIIYNLSDLGLTGGAVSKYIIGTSDESYHSITLEYLNNSLGSIESVTLAVYGFKDDCTTEAIPTDAAYVKIHGTPGALVYIWEITAATALSRGANNLTDAYDGNINTSANILSDTGWIIYNLSDLGLSGGEGSKFTIGTSDEGDHSITLEYLNNSLASIDSVTLDVSGFKDDCTTAAIPTDAAFVRINGTPGALVYIWEIIALSP